MQWCQDEHFIIMNSFFKLTWISCDNNIRNQIDYFLINRCRNVIKSVKTYPGAEINADHNLLLAKINIKPKKTKKHAAIRRIAMEVLRQVRIKHKMRSCLNERLDDIARTDISNIGEAWKNIRNTFTKVTHEYFINKGERKRHV